MKTIRKACVQAVFDEFETQGEIVLSLIHI